MEEIFKELPYSKGYYISNYGNVKKINIDGNGEKTVKQIKTYLIGPKNNKELVFTCAYYGTKGYYCKLQLAYIVASLFLNDDVDYRYIKVGFRDGDHKNCRADNLFLYEIDYPLTIQFIRGCITAETITKTKNNIKKQYKKKKEKYDNNTDITQ